MASYKIAALLACSRILQRHYAKRTIFSMLTLYTAHTHSLLRLTGWGS